MHYIVQGRSPDRLAAAVEGLGGSVVCSLDTLGRLSGTALLSIQVPDDIHDAQLLALPAVSVAEGEYLHPFFRDVGFFPGELIAPAHLAALALHLLPPALFRLPATVECISCLLGSAPEDADLWRTPGHRSSLLALPVRGAASAPGSDMGIILDMIRVPQAHDLSQGQGAIVAIVDSGVPASVVPSSQRLGGWGDGSDPWSDEMGHGGMVAQIVLAVAPDAQIVSVKPAATMADGMSSISMLAAMDYLAGLAQSLRAPIVSNHSWGVNGVRNLVFPCNIMMSRVVRLLDEARLVMTSWAAGNSRYAAGDATVTNFSMNSTKWSTSCGALTRGLKPQHYSALGGQCYPWHPTVAAPTFGVVPVGAGYKDMGEEGGGTSACAPQVSGTLALMMAVHPGRSFREYRAALRAGASSAALGLAVPYSPAAGAGLLQADGAIRAVPTARLHPSWLTEWVTPSSISRLGDEMK